ncbi:MAG: dprA [Bacteroidetes bacterium]|nr:dprA [Bacteroidota bacterium]
MATSDDSLLYTIALTLVPDIGSVLAQNLIAYCGSAEEVFKASKKKLLSIPLIGEERANSILESDVMKLAEEEMKFISDYNIKALIYTDPDYPRRLRECTDMPIVLYHKGNADLNTDKIVSIVGTRNITEYGKEMTKKFVEGLGDQNILVISGLAYGVDVASHHAALDNKMKTVGVLAHGLKMIYPPQHKTIAKQMVDNGGLLTEYTSQHKMAPGNFPARNRIVAGMCDAVVVIESAAKGGALITANIANSYNKEVFAIPGRIGDKYSAGCNFLVRTFKANLTENTGQFLEAMHWQDGNKPKKKRAQLSLHLSPQEQKIYQLLSDHTELEIDKIVSLSEMTGGEIAATMLEMEMSGVLVSLPGKRYKLVNL